MVVAPSSIRSTTYHYLSCPIHTVPYVRAIPPQSAKRAGVGWDWGKEPAANAKAKAKANGRQTTRTPGPTPLPPLATPPPRLITSARLTPPLLRDAHPLHHHQVLHCAPGSISPSTLTPRPPANATASASPHLAFCTGGLTGDPLASSDYSRLGRAFSTQALGLLCAVLLLAAAGFFACS